MKVWQCVICGLVYDEAAGWPDEGILPGTSWDGRARPLGMPRMPS